MKPIRITCAACRRNFALTGEQFHRLQHTLAVSDPCPHCGKPFALSLREQRPKVVISPPLAPSVPTDTQADAVSPPFPLMEEARSSPFTPEPAPILEAPPFEPLPDMSPIERPPFEPSAEGTLAAVRPGTPGPPQPARAAGSNAIDRWWKKRSPAQQWGMLIAALILLVAIIWWPTASPSKPPSSERTTTEPDRPPPAPGDNLAPPWIPETDPKTP
jgi:hypothetical protein